MWVTKMINLLTDDKSYANDKSDIDEKDREMIKAILYQERQNKERAWDSDAEKFISKLLDENIPGVES